MEPSLDSVIGHIEEEFDGQILRGARHYVEVNLASRAREMGFSEIADKCGHAKAIVPLRSPKQGMKVRIDGRTFVNYAQYKSGIAVPGYISEMTDRHFHRFEANDSMICNFH
jgi:hypothetical protein